ncbi:MAG: hypothetical protein QHH07_11645 [Sedimentisphaerales bacterium]|nr:hypothetical protein [Sedimentisphaerales bacterium]
MSIETCDHLATLLKAILRVTSARDRILSDNLRSADQPQFVPHDLPIGSLVNHLNAILDRIEALGDTSSWAALDEIVCLIEAMGPEVDHDAKRLLASDKAQYLRYQQARMLQNCISARIAKRLLMQCMRSDHPLEPDRSASAAGLAGMLGHRRCRLDGQVNS